MLAAADGGNGEVGEAEAALAVENEADKDLAEGAGEAAGGICSLCLQIAHAVTFLAGSWCLLLQITKAGKPKQRLLMKMRQMRIWLRVLEKLQVGSCSVFLAVCQTQCAISYQKAWVFAAADGCSMLTTVSALQCAAYFLSVRVPQPCSDLAGSQSGFAPSMRWLSSRDWTGSARIRRLFALAYTPVFK